MYNFGIEPREAVIISQMNFFYTPLFLPFNSLYVSMTFIALWSAYYSCTLNLLSISDWLYIFISVQWGRFVSQEKIIA